MPKIWGCFSTSKHPLVFTLVLPLTQTYHIHNTCISTDCWNKANHLAAFCAWDSSPHFLVTPEQLMRPSLVPRFISSFLYKKEPGYEARWGLVLAETHSAHFAWHLGLSLKEMWFTDCWYINLHTYTECSYTEFSCWLHLFRPLLESPSQSWFTRRVPGTATTDSVLVNVTKSC